MQFLIKKICLFNKIFLQILVTVNIELDQNSYLQHRLSCFCSVCFSLFFYQFINPVQHTLGLGIRDILVQIRIPGSVPLTNASDSFLQDVKKNFYTYFTGASSSVLKIKFFAKFCVKILFCKHYFCPLNTFMRRGKDPELDSDPYL